MLDESREEPKAYKNMLLTQLYCKPREYHNDLGKSDDSMDQIDQING
jgi:hypothetical protein